MVSLDAADSEEVARGPEPRLPPSAWRWPRQFTPVILLLISATLAAFVYFLVSELRWWEFQTATWDLGIYQQALWSTSHGRPFYESADYETGGFSTFLQVHSAFTLYAIVPLYAAFPSPSTLFAVQSAVVAAACIPLYYFANAITSNARRSLLAALLYLASSATISSVLYDFHVEAFVPLVYFSFLYCFETRRYLASGAVALVGFATMEVVPALLAGVALCYGIPELITLLRRLRNTRGAWFTPLLEWPRTSALRFLASISLLVASVAGYLVLLEIREVWLAGWLGVSSFPPSAVMGGYTIGASPSTLGLSLSNLGVGLGWKLEYWVLLLSLVAFLPLLSPRSLALTLPWFSFTMLSADLNLTEIGWQYGFLAGPPLIAGLVFALPRLDRIDWRQFVRRKLRGNRQLVGRPSGWSRRAAGAGWLVPASLLLVTNLAISPLGPGLLGLPDGNGYRWSYPAPPGFAAAVQLAGLIPAGSAILASDDLFPLVANDLNAYSLHWDYDPTLVLPFNATSPPTYVFLAQNRLYAVPPWLESELYNSTIFGLRGEVWSTPAGAVLLFESGYRGPPVALAVPQTRTMVIDPSELSLGPAGYEAPDPVSPTGVAVSSAAGSLGLIAQSAGYVIAGGTYLLNLYLHTWTNSSASPSPTTDALTVDANAFGQSLLFETSVPYGPFSGAGYAAFNLTLTLPELSLEVVYRFYAAGANLGVSLAEIRLTPTAG
ncbi:MAG: DUF2079 domain-containing protein [Thermoplasmata archaeon]|nr:DUF2079 domain-containing protein [Thermoplasmata archaeon]